MSTVFHTSSEIYEVSQRFPCPEIHPFMVNKLFEIPICFDIACMKLEFIHLPVKEVQSASNEVLKTETAVTVRYECVISLIIEKSSRWKKKNLVSQ